MNLSKCLIFCGLIISLASNDLVVALFFPTNSAYGIFAAIAVPLDLPHRDVFISYNFEANYNLPFEWNIPPWATNVEYENIFGETEEEARTCSNCTETSSPPTSIPTQNTTTAHERRRRRAPLLTRTTFYHILKDKFQRHGYPGEPCLLRLICETNASSLGEINGILGNLVHIIFSPSTSMNENLPLRYYQAEVDGHHDHCHHYEDECKESILDLISSPLSDIVKTIMSKNH